MKIFSIFCVVVFATFCLVGCKDENTPNIPTPIALFAPNGIEITGDTLLWNNVSNAVGYIVCNGVLEEITFNTFYNISGVGNHKLKVKALGDGIKFLDSDFTSEKAHTISKQLETPEINIEKTASTIYTLSWESIDDAIIYEVSVNGETQETELLEAEIELVSIGLYEIKVRALGHSYFATSQWSDILGINVYSAIGMLRQDRDAKRNADILLYEHLIATSSNAATVQDAEMKLMAIRENISFETSAEGLIKIDAMFDFQDVFVSRTNGFVQVIIQRNENITQLQAVKLLTILRSLQNDLDIDNVLVSVIS